MKLLQKIHKEITEIIDLKTIDYANTFYIHFGICMYIRNKYLWGNERNIKLMQKFFNCKNIDTLSHMILNEIKKEDFF